MKSQLCASAVPFSMAPHRQQTQFRADHRSPSKARFLSRRNEAKEDTAVLWDGQMRVKREEVRPHWLPLAKKRRLSSSCCRARSWRACIASVRNWRSASSHLNLSLPPARGGASPLRRAYFQLSSWSSHSVVLLIE